MMRYQFEKEILTIMVVRDSRSECLFGRKKHRANYTRGDKKYAEKCYKCLNF